MRSSAAERTYYPRQLWNVSGDEWRPMMVVVVVVVMMITSAHGEPCDATRNVRCSGTSGKEIHLRLASSQPFEIAFRKGAVVVFKCKNSITVFHMPEFGERWKFFAANGTLIINPAERSDSASYTVEIYEDEDSGELTGNHTVELKIDATHGGNARTGTGSGSGAVLPAVLCVLVILVCVCVTAGVFYVRKNRHTRTAAQTPDSQGELHYADISVLAIHQRQQREAEKSQQTQESVYSTVQHRS